MFLRSVLMASVFLGGLRSAAGGALVALMAALAALPAHAAEPVKVVASFSILADMVRVVGGENISLTTLIGPKEDSHSFAPGASDNRSLAQAQILVTNGLDFETWMPRLVRSSGFKGLEIVASKGVTPRSLDAGDHDAHDHAHSQGHDGHGHDAKKSAAVDPHAWQDLSNGMRYVRNIADGLSQVDPANRDQYQRRAALYIEEMAALHKEINTAFSGIPSERRRVVTAHDAFGYLGQAYDIVFASAAGLSSDAEPSARDIARLITQVKGSHSAALFTEGATNSSVIEQISRETGVALGGTLFADTLDSPDKSAGTYLGMFKWNADQLLSALRR